MRLRTFVVATLGLYVGVRTTVYNFDRIRPYLPRDVEVVVKKIPVIERVPTLPPLYISRKDLEEMVYDQAPAAGFDARVFLVIGEVESGSGDQILTNHERFEPSLYNVFRAQWTPGMNETERRRFATSYGIFQIIYGWHKKTCGLSRPEELLDPKTNLRCAIRIWGRAWEESAREHRDPQGIFWASFYRYNGSGAFARHYADVAMKRYQTLIFSDIMKQMPQVVAEKSEAKGRA